jgi:hypothetical protein
MAEDEFEQEIKELVNRLSLDAKYGTPDFILAKFLRDCLQLWEQTLKIREGWFDRKIDQR